MIQISKVLRGGPGIPLGSPMCEGPKFLNHNFLSLRDPSSIKVTQRSKKDLNPSTLTRDPGIPCSDFQLQRKAHLFFGGAGEVCILAMKLDAHTNVNNFFLNDLQEKRVRKITDETKLATSQYLMGDTNKNNEYLGYGLEKASMSL